MTTSGYNHADDIVKFVQNEYSARSVSRTLLEAHLRERNSEMEQLEDELRQLLAALRAFGAEVPGQVEEMPNTGMTSSQIQHFRLDIPETEEENSR